MACRRVAVAACETLGVGTTAPPLNTTALVIKAGDTLDFGIDWKAWATANAATIKTSAWAAAGSSPDTPTIGVTTYIDAANQVTAFMLDASGAAAGDEYLIDNTVVFEAAVGAAIALADRTVKRRLQIKVTA
jgi:hypothetical protein